MPEPEEKSGDILPLNCQFTTLLSSVFGTGKFAQLQEGSCIPTLKNITIRYSPRTDKKTGPLNVSMNEDRRYKPE
jgi:hypothetical protein